MQNVSNHLHYPNAQYLPFQAPTVYTPYLPQPLLVPPGAMNLCPVPPPHFVFPSQPVYLPLPMHPALFTANMPHQWPYSQLPQNNSIVVPLSSSIVAPPPSPYPFSARTAQTVTHKQNETIESNVNKGLNPNLAPNTSEICIRISIDLSWIPVLGVFWGWVRHFAVNLFRALARQNGGSGE